MVCAHIGTPNATKRCKSYLLFESKIDMLEGVLMVPDRCQPIPCRSIFNILIVCFLHGIVLPQYCVHERIYFHSTYQHMIDVLDEIRASSPDFMKKWKKTYSITWIYPLPPGFELQRKVYFGIPGRPKM